MSNKEIAKIFKAFSDERRIEILKLLIHGEKCACKLLDEFEITQPTLSHHMKILCETGIVLARKDGKWIHYSISEEGSTLAINVLKSLTECASSLEKVECSCENI